MTAAGRGRPVKRKLRNDKRMRFRYSFLKILSGSDLAHRRLPYMQASAADKGPVMWLTACCHGDEVGGIVVVHEVFRRLKKTPLKKGALHAFPLMNPLGFEAAARHITLSEEDLNRVFPGNALGTLAERIANLIFQTIAETNPSIVLDLHNDWIRSIPYTLLDPPAEETPNDAERRAGELAAETGFLRVIESNPLRRTLSHSLLRHKIAALTIELGESFVVNETNVEFGVKSVFNILRKLDMVPDHTVPFSHHLPGELNTSLPLTYCQEPTSSTSGIIRFLVRPGGHVRRGEPVAKIVNSVGRLQETITARHDAIVLGLCDSAVAYPGAPVAAFARW